MSNFLMHFCIGLLFTGVAVEPDKKPFKKITFAHFLCHLFRGTHVSLFCILIENVSETITHCHEVVALFGGLYPII